MAYNSKLTDNNILIEYSNKNGHIRLIKESYKYIDRYDIPFGQDISVFKVQYSADYDNWLTSAKFKPYTKVAHIEHFNKLVNALNTGTRLN